MNKKGLFIGALTVAATVVVSVLRMVVTPKIVAGNVNNTLNMMLLSAVVAALICLLLACSGKRSTTVVLQGKRLTAVSAGALFTGVSMAVSVLFAFSNWTGAGVMPYPANAHISTLDVSLLYLLVAFGVIGGGFFVVLALRWQLKGQAVRGVMRLTALAPLVWSWIRVVRYEMSYISSIHVFQHAYDLLLIVSEMLFFLWFARYVSALEDTPPRFLTGIALCAGVLATSGCATRVAMLLMGNKDAFEACGLITATDLGVALLAFSFAFGQLTSKETVTENRELSVADTVPEPPVQKERKTINERGEMLVTDMVPEMEGEGAAYLLDLSGEFITDGDDEEIPEQRRPLELEDVLNDIITRIENGEK